MTIQKRKNAPQWFKLRDEVLASIGLLDSGKSDRLTYNVMLKATTVLMSGQPLPDKLKDTFIENIRRRTRYSNFVHTGPLQLTHHQCKHARKMGHDALPSFADLLAQHGLAVSDDAAEGGNKGEIGSDEAMLLLALQRWFIHQSSSVQPDFALLSTFLGLERKHTPRTAAKLDQAARAT